MEGTEASAALKPWVGTTRGVLGHAPNGFPIIRASTSLPRGVIKVTKKEAREDREEEETGEANSHEVNAGESTEEVQMVFSPFELMTLAEAAPGREHLAQRGAASPHRPRGGGGRRGRQCPAARQLALGSGPQLAEAT